MEQWLFAPAEDLALIAFLHPSVIFTLRFKSGHASIALAFSWPDPLSPLADLLVKEQPHPPLPFIHPLNDPPISRSFCASFLHWHLLTSLALQTTWAHCLRLRLFNFSSFLVISPTFAFINSQEMPWQAQPTSRCSAEPVVSLPWREPKGVVYKPLRLALGGAKELKQQEEIPHSETSATLVQGLSSIPLLSCVPPSTSLPIFSLMNHKSISIA